MSLYEFQATTMSLGTVYPVSPYPALLIKEEQSKTLLVADLHIGWEMSLTDRGIHIPSQAMRLQKKLKEVLAKTGATKLILLGDIKQTIPKITMEEWRFVPEFLEGLQEVVKEVTIIPGNHDGDLEPLTPPEMRMSSSGGIVIGVKPKVAIFHGHAWPIPEAFTADVLVMSHIHPVVWFRDNLGLWIMKQVWLKSDFNTKRMIRAYLKYLNIRPEKDPLKTFKDRFGFEPSNPRLVVMPTFNDLLGGVSVERIEKKASGPIIGEGRVDLSNAEIYLLDGTYLGTVMQMRTLRQEFET